MRCWEKIEKREFQECFERLEPQQKAVMREFLKCEPYEDRTERGKQNAKIARVLKPELDKKGINSYAQTVARHLSNIHERFGLRDAGSRSMDMRPNLRKLFEKYREVWQADEDFNKVFFENEKECNQTNNQRLEIQKKQPYVSISNQAPVRASSKGKSQISEEVISTSNKIEERYRDHFLYWNDQFSNALRLVGANDEFFPPSAVHIIPHKEKDAEYKLPGKLLLYKDEIISRCEQEAKANGRLFFDGSNTRLIDHRITPIDSTEQKHFYLHLGSVGWYDYTVCDWALEHLVENKTIDEIKNYIDLDEVAYSRSVKQSKLSNLLCTATTIVTEDEFILYSRRGRQVSAQSGLLTSCVAENINRDIDQSLETTPSYELPVPFKVVLRGIEEEASPEIVDCLYENLNSVFLLGMDFQLLSFHPDLLFLVFVPMSYEKFRKLCIQSPGKDFFEGKIRAISLSEKHKINRLLAAHNWVPGGKSSFIRALEFIVANERNYPEFNMEQIVNTVKAKNK